MLKLAPCTALVAILCFPWPWSHGHYRPALVRPLSWTSPVYEDIGGGMGIPTGATAVKNHCTAWAYQTPDRHTHWITAAHCVVDEDTGVREDHDYQIDGHAVTVERAWWPDDIASLTGYDVPDGLTIADSEPALLGAVVIRGYPMGYAFLVSTRGYLAAVDAHFQEDAEGIVYNLYNTTSAPGNSGSPVFDARDRVVGLLQIGWGRGFSPMSGGMELVTLREFLSTL